MFKVNCCCLYNFAQVYSQLYWTCRVRKCRRNGKWRFSATPNSENGGVCLTMKRNCVTSQYHPIFWALSDMYKTENVWLYVSLFLMHSHSFEQICMKFGVWHPYTFWMVRGLTSAAAACGLALHVPSVRHCKSVTDRGHLTSGAQN